MDAHGDANDIAALRAEIARLRAERDARARDSEMLARLLDHIPVMICYYNLDGEVLLLNRAFQEMIGYTLEDTRRVNIMEACYPDPAYRAELWAFMTRAHGAWRDVVVRTKSGEDLPSSWTNMPLQDGTQIGIGIDARERIAAEGARRALAAQVDTLLTRVIDGFIPICANCKSVRTAEERWVSVENYIMSRSEAEFTHGLCPDCQTRLYPGLLDDD